MTVINLTWQQYKVPDAGSQSDFPAMKIHLSPELVKIIKPVKSDLHVSDALSYAPTGGCVLKCFFVIQHKTSIKPLSAISGDNAKPGMVIHE